MTSTEVKSASTVVRPKRKVKIIKRRSHKKYYSYTCTLPRNFIESLESEGVDIAQARLQLEYEVAKKTLTMLVVENAADEDEDPDDMMD